MSAVDVYAPRGVVSADAADIAGSGRTVRLEPAPLDHEPRRNAVAEIVPEHSLDDWRRRERRLRAMIDAAQERAEIRLLRARIEAVAIIEAARIEAEARFALSANREAPLRLVPPSRPTAALPAATVHTAAPIVHVKERTSWLEDALAALDLEDPTEALAAVAEATRAYGGNPGEPTAAPAEAANAYASFWEEEREAVAARQWVRALAPFEVLVPMVVVFVALALMGLWIN